ncbi:MAG: hypothetical protein AB1627_15335 [Chloroflexota bacterium]
MLETPGGFIETQLGFVAVTVALANAVRLVNGRGDVRSDPVARADCPMSPRALTQLCQRLNQFRNEILHLHDKFGGGRHVTLSYTRDGLVLSSTVGRDEVGHDTFSREEALAILDQLNPWLGRHRERLLGT